MRAVTVLVLVATSTWATIRPVPGVYPTIQGALNHTLDGDTVLVDVGVYAEAPIAPPVSFVLKGNVIPDTGDYPRPVIDPTPLPGSDSLFCLLLPGSDSVTLEDMAFRSGAAMYPRRTYHGRTSSGVRDSTAHLIVRRCFFDSTVAGILGMGISNSAVDVQSCHFVYVSSSIGMENQGRANVSDCLFEHCSGWAHVMGGEGSQVIRCRFGGNPSTYLCDLSGRNLVIRNCLFGPSLPGEASWDPPLNLTYPSGVIENNVFQGLGLGHALIFLQCACDDTDIIVIRQNTFIGNLVVQQGDGAADVLIQHTDLTRHGQCGARIDSNIFADNEGGQICKGVHIWGTDARATGNRFSHLHPSNPNVPTILTEPPQSAVLRSNHFDSTGIAVGFLNNVPDTLDARWNWWGDSTGPHEPLTHPDGRGDTVASGTDFNPWCTDSSTCEEPNTVQDRHFILHPSSFRLSSYPNPFNSTTTLRLEVPEAEIVRIELFDILGRRVRELWSGAVSNEKEITFDGSALASGVYFVRATSTTWNRPLVSAKVVLLK